MKETALRLLELNAEFVNRKNNEDAWGGTYPAGGRELDEIVAEYAALLEAVKNQPVA